MTNNDEQRALAILGQVTDDAVPLISGGALKAVSRLVGAAVDYVALPLEDHVQSRSMVRKALAAAAAKQATGDDALVARTLDSLLDREARKQRNKDRVVREAIADLGAEAVTAPQEDLDGDWLNVFERYAEDATSEKLQQLWGRVLSGEIRKRGTTSVRTLRFLSEIDQTAAERIDAVLRIAIGKYIIKTPSFHTGEMFDQLLALEEIGVVTGVTGMLSTTATPGPIGKIHLDGRRYSLLVSSPPHQQITFGTAFLTKLGLELREVIKVYEDLDSIRAAARHLKAETGVAEIAILERRAEGWLVLETVA